MTQPVNRDDSPTNPSAEVNLGVESGHSHFDAWNQDEHAVSFGGWENYRASKVVRLCKQFNESQLFLTVHEHPSCNTVSDIGCATGRLYPFFRKMSPSLEYKGFDLSHEAIEWAKQSFPNTSFVVFDGNVKSLPNIESDIIFCRDVIHHQPDPKAFLQDLYDVAKKFLILRVRTREIGDSVFDISTSCQLSNGKWVPYMVFNSAELVDLLRSYNPKPKRITLWRHPEVLGGKEGRFLPKELYFEDSGTAETAVLIEKGEANVAADTIVTLETHLESRGYDRPFWLRALKSLVTRMGM